ERELPRRHRATEARALRRRPALQAGPRLESATKTQMRHDDKIVCVFAADSRRIRRFAASAQRSLRHHSALCASATPWLHPFVSFVSFVVDHRLKYFWNSNRFSSSDRSVTYFDGPT